jgi:hypothetical protein
MDLCTGLKGGLQTDYLYNHKNEVLYTLLEEAICNLCSCCDIQKYELNTTGTALNKTAS